HLIDQVIRAARLAGVECATWMPGGTNGEIQASVIDGAGAQATMIVTHAGRKHRLSGVLFKQGLGVADAWTLEPESKRHIGRKLKEMTDSEARLMPVSRTYLDLAIGHHLRAGLERRMPPPARLLQWLKRSKLRNGGLQARDGRKCLGDSSRRCRRNFFLAPRFGRFLPQAHSGRCRADGPAPGLKRIRRWRTCSTASIGARGARCGMRSSPGSSRSTG